MSEVSEKYMQRCFELASMGKGNVSPNPLVGCVIVNDGRIIGEGYHEIFGGPHAEVNALKSVEDKELLKGAVLYVNLEPCSHFGKTPPCADLIINQGIKKVVISNKDPNPLVNGNGIKRLQDAGIEVVINVLEKEGFSLNKCFFTHKIKHRPYVILKWAQSADGFMGRENERVQISGQIAQVFSHKLRHDYDAILVGTKTALVDNPKLTDRYWNGKQPVRVLIDKDLKVPQDSPILDGKHSSIVYNHLKNLKDSSNLEYVKLNNEKDVVFQILEDLNSRGITSLVVEGGATTLQKFLDLEVWDELCIIQSKDVILHRGLKSPNFTGTISGEQNLVSDIAYLYKPIRS